MHYSIYISKVLLVTSPEVTTYVCSFISQWRQLPQDETIRRDGAEHANRKCHIMTDC